MTRTNWLRDTSGARTIGATKKQEPWPEPLIVSRAFGEALTRRAPLPRGIKIED